MDKRQEWRTQGGELLLRVEGLEGLQVADSGLDAAGRGRLWHTLQKGGRRLHAQQVDLQHQLLQGHSSHLGHL